jgi:hypothetical protein
MMRRRGGRGIVSTMATTAVVAGTAGAVQHKQQQRWQANAAQQQAQAQEQQAAAQSQAQVAEIQAQMEAMQAQQAAAAAAPAQAVPAAGDFMAQLQQLAQMKESGLLTEEQFEAAKAKLLGV